MLKLKIVSPEKVFFEGEIESIVVPGTLGRFEVLVGHAPIISSLEKGSVEYTTTDGEKTQFDIHGGFVEVQKDVISLCVEIK